jgi:hypothetical protein
MSAYAAVRTGLVYKKYTVGDAVGSAGSDYTLIDVNTITQDQVNTATGLIDVNKMQKVFTMALATKYNYWATNHHIGQGSWAAYVLTGVKAIAPEMVTEALKSELHMFCHWFGTHGALRLFKILTPVMIAPVH